MSDAVTRLNSALSGHYRVERELGEGGMATVYLADDLRHDRKVAIKVLRPEVGQSVGAERFLQEIHIAAQLSHPNILSLIDSGEADGLLYYVMFYVAGESLRDLLDRERQLPVGDAVRLACEAAEALGHAHASGIVHRDVKPENILIEAGHALVCDFGIARAVGEAAGGGLTRTGMAIGTPAYMSPEQATADEVDARTDIYSLGCVLYEMLTGGTPYHGFTPQAILARKAAEPVPSIRVVRDTVPEHVAEALTTALARVPADRFTTADEFAKALKGEGLARRPSAVGWAGPWRRRVGRVLGAAALVTAGALGFSALWGGDGPAAIRTTAQKVTAQSGMENFPSLSPDGLWVVFAGMGEGKRDIFLRSVGGRQSFNLTEDSDADDYSPAFSFDGEQIAFRSSRQGGGLFVMGRTGEAVRRVTSAGFNPKWSPDGTRLVYSTEHVEVLPLHWESHAELWIVDVTTGETERLSAGDAVYPTWSPDGRWIAFSSRIASNVQMDIHIMPAEGGEPSFVTSDISSDWSPAWSPDGEYLYFSSDRAGSMNLWRIPMNQRSGEPTGVPEPVVARSEFVAHPSISADGRRIAYTAVQLNQSVEKAAFDPDAGILSEPVPLTTGSRSWRNPDPSPDGTSVVFYSGDQPEGDLYIVRGDGVGPPRMLTGDSALDRVPRWSPDGTRVTYFSTRSGGIHLWAIRADGSDNEQLTFGDYGTYAAWSPDGSRLAVNSASVAGPGRTPVLFDPSRSWQEQEPEALPPADSSMAPFSVIDWSPDGSRLAGMTDITDEGILIYTLATRTYERLSDFGQWPAWLPDSRRLLFVSGGNSFYVIDGETKEIRQVYSTARDVIGPPRLTRDGRTVVFTRRVTEGDVWLMEIN
jgi:eukaryotic-like serine/threonine-protein kinase